MLRLLRNRIGDDLGHPWSCSGCIGPLRATRSSHWRSPVPWPISSTPSEPGEPVPVPDDLQQLLRARLGTLPSSAVEALVAAAAATRPTMELVVGSAGDPRPRARRDRGSGGGGHHPGRRRTGSLLPPAPGVDRLRCGVHGDPAPGPLARLAELVVDPEERARHLALAAPGPEPAVAEALDTAAWHASARGASDAAADLAELARKLTPPRYAPLAPGGASTPPSISSMRATRCAPSRCSRRPSRAPIPGLGRAAIIFQLAAISWLDLGRVESLCQQAIEEAEGDPLNRDGP